MQCTYFEYHIQIRQTIKMINIRDPYGLLKSIILVHKSIYNKRFTLVVDMNRSNNLWIRLKCRA